MMTNSSLVILAHSDAEIRRARGDALASEALRIEEAESGNEVLELVARHAPDVLLLDTELTDVDGIEVCTRLKSNARFASPVILSMPAFVCETRKKAAIASGADAYLVEPLDLELLVAAVQSMLRLGQRLGRAERRVSDLSQRVSAAQAEIERFASQTTHDVEEPLRAVTTFIQLIEERRQGGFSETERAYMGQVLAASARVRRLLRGFLSYTQAGRGPAHFGPLDLRAAAGAAVQTMSHRVKETCTAIQFEGTWPTVWGDFGQVQQVFEQVIGNAIDYRRPGSAAAVTLGVRKTADELYAVFVADNGPGIPPDFQAAIFLPFKRLHGHEIPGAGMGLAISKRIVEAHGGHMWVESKPDHGASFCFTLRGEPVP